MQTQMMLNSGVMPGLYAHVVALFYAMSKGLHSDHSERFFFDGFILKGLFLKSSF
jgi:hypothetical protein